MNFLNELTSYHLLAILAAFLFVGVPLTAYFAKRFGEWLHKKMRRW